MLAPGDQPSVPWDIIYMIIARLDRPGLILASQTNQELNVEAESLLYKDCSATHTIFPALYAALRARPARAAFVRRLQLGWTPPDPKFAIMRSEMLPTLTNLVDLDMFIPEVTDWAEDNMGIFPFLTKCRFYIGPNVVPDILLPFLKAHPNLESLRLKAHESATGDIWSQSFRDALRFRQGVNISENLFPSLCNIEAPLELIPSLVPYRPIEKVDLTGNSLDAPISLPYIIKSTRTVSSISYHAAVFLPTDRYAPLLESIAAYAPATRYLSITSFWAKEQSARRLGELFALFPALETLRFGPISDPIQRPLVDDHDKSKAEIEQWARLSPRLTTVIRPARDPKIWKLIKRKWTLTSSDIK